MITKTTNETLQGYCYKIGTETKIFQRMHVYS